MIPLRTSFFSKEDLSFEKGEMVTRSSSIRPNQIQCERSKMINSNDIFKVEFGTQGSSCRQFHQRFLYESAFVLSPKPKHN